MRGVRDKHGHETPFEKSIRQGAGATLLHFTNPGLAPHLPPSPPYQISAHSASKITSQPARTLQPKNEELKLLSTIRTLILATLTKTKHKSPVTMRRSHDVPPARNALAWSKLHHTHSLPSVRKLRLAHAENMVTSR